MWTEWKQGRFIEIGRFWNLWTKNACIETYTFRIISFFLLKKKNRLSKGLLQWNRRKKKHQMHRMKSVDNLKTAVMAFVKEHFSQIESNDGFVCTVIGKHEDSKCVWNALLLFVLDPRKIYLFFFLVALFSDWVGCLPTFRWKFTWHLFGFSKEENEHQREFWLEINSNTSGLWMKQQTWTDFARQHK